METVSVTLTERFQYERNRQRIVRSLENMGITQPERRRRSKGYKRASELLSRNGSSISLKGDSGRRDSTLTVTSPALGLRKGSLIGNGNDMNDMLTRKGSIQGGGVTTLILQTRRRSDEKLRRKRLAQNQRRLLLQKFIMVGKLIGFMFRLCKKHFHVADSTDSAVMYGMGDGNSETELLFDLSSFKAQKQSKVTQEAKRILKMEPRERTEREIYHVQVALRNVESIACYPVTMHRKLSKVGWYQCFEAKRLILRQGYEPINYYFILSGSAVLSEFDVEEDKSRVVSILNKGESFGEQAILTSTLRETTVVAVERVELLCIDIDDYIDIFMSGGLETLSETENLEFLRGLYFLHNWPIHLIADNPKKCTLSYFRKGQALVTESDTDKWIYIVKSGSCDLLKKVKVLKQGEVRHEEQIPERESKIDKLFSTRHTRDDVEIFVQQLRECHEPDVSSTGLSSINGPRMSPSLKTSNTPMKGTPHSLKRKVKKYRTPQENGTEENAEKTQVERDAAGHSHMFVKIKTLTKGDTFGLADLAYGTRKNFFLISEGAECVMLSKKFYLNNASVDTLLTIKKRESKLPTDAELDSILQTQINWDQYRKHMVEWKLAEKQTPR